MARQLGRCFELVDALLSHTRADAGSQSLLLDLQGELGRLPSSESEGEGDKSHTPRVNRRSPTE